MREHSEVVANCANLWKIHSDPLVDERLLCVELMSRTCLLSNEFFVKSTYLLGYIYFSNTKN